MFAFGPLLKDLLEVVDDEEDPLAPILIELLQTLETALDYCLIFFSRYLVRQPEGWFDQ